MVTTWLNHLDFSVNQPLSFDSLVLVLGHSLVSVRGHCTHACRCMQYNDQSRLASHANSDCAGEQVAAPSIKLLAFWHLVAISTPNAASPDLPVVAQRKARSLQDRTALSQPALRVQPGSPTIRSSLQSQVSSLMTQLPGATVVSRDISEAKSPRGLRSSAPATSPGLWRRSSLPSQFNLQQQMSSLSEPAQEEQQPLVSRLRPYEDVLTEVAAGMPCTSLWPRMQTVES